MRSLPWAVKDILNATGGKLLSGNVSEAFFDISIDSRNISATDLFVAIRGERYDGHDFIESVHQSGVKGVLIQKDRSGMDSVNVFMNQGGVCIAVAETIKALGDLAGFRKKQVGVSTVGITGSNGKTTTKEMIAEVLGRSFKVLSTQGNLNNEIGLPLTLFQLKASHQWAVLEMGMNHPGEISRLTRICSPDIGVITNVGAAHLEGLGSIEAVARAKGEILGEMNPKGTAVLNGDDPLVVDLAKTSPVRVCLYGQDNLAADVRAQSISDHGETLFFELVLPTGKVPVNLKLAGRYMISNALAAAAVGQLAGLPPEEIKKGLEQVKPVKGRMNLIETGAGIHLIDDTYNANPGSTKAAVCALANLGKNARCALVLGDMMELGTYATSLHHEVGKVAFRKGVQRLFLTGDFAADVCAGALSEGMPAADIIMGTKEEVLKAIHDWMKPGDWILVKGSRMMKMETIISALSNDHAPVESVI